jgi:hypothetical protein
MIFGTWSDRMLCPWAPRLIRDQAIQRWGGARLMRWGKAYNRLRYASRLRRHDAAYAARWEELLRANNGGSPPPRRLTLANGWTRDDSHTLPHLDALLEQTDAIIRERGGRKHSDIQQPFLRSLLFPGDLEKYPALLDFILSSEVLDVAARHLGTVPVLSRTRPPGVRFMESNAALDPGAGGPFRESQLFHLDLHDAPLVYVLVLAQDTPLEAGPWHFLPAEASDRATRALGYRTPGAHYRVTDEAMGTAVDPSETVVFTGRRGDVLFIDSSACFHFGSRRSTVPRFQVMYALTTPCRTDLSLTFMPQIPCPVSPGDSELRRMVLEPWK